MKSKSGLDMDRIARVLRADRRSRVRARSGAFGAAQLASDVRERFRTPATGGRATDPAWKERRLIPLASKTLARLEAIAARLEAKHGVHVEAMQLAALLLEHSTERVTDEDARKLVEE